jgi:TM2 domain-containing membrane protein YozV
MENEKHEAWNQPVPQNRPENKKLVAGILGILVGGLGIHKFILGYTNEGIIQIVITVVTCGVGSLVGFIEGIIYLTKTDEEFYQTYQVNKKAWF